MRGVPVDDEVDRARRIVQQPLAEVDEYLRIGGALVDGEPQRALGGHRGRQCRDGQDDLRASSPTTTAIPIISTALASDETIITVVRW